LFPLCYIVPPVFTNSDKGKYKGKKIVKMLGSKEFVKTI